MHWNGASRCEYDGMSMETETTTSSNPLSKVIEKIEKR